jgi:hypothetical protein
MILFELRACWAEYYDCPDNGQTRICDTYETVGFAIADDTRLQSEYDEYRNNAETAVKRALRQHGDAHVTIGEHGEVTRHGGRMEIIQ